MTRLDVLKLAGLAGVDPRTARKALREGPDAIRGIPGERCAKAMRDLGLATADDREVRAS